MTMKLECQRRSIFLDRLTVRITQTGCQRLGEAGREEYGEKFDALVVRRRLSVHRLEFFVNDKVQCRLGNAKVGGRDALVEA